MSLRAGERGRRAFIAMKNLTRLVLLCAGTLTAAGQAARTLPIAGRAWAGSSVNVVANIRQALCTHDRTQYAAFYDADGYMVLAKRDLDATAWQTRRTEYKGSVADAHNSISIAVDGAGCLHVAWDHHGNPLNYARAVAPGSLALGPKTSLTGQRESRVTYPQFFLLPGGDLLFLYRDGASGRGGLVLDRYATGTGKWTSVQSNLIDGEGRRSPYWSMTVDARGTLHLAWNWRDSSDVATNHDLAYARSTDVGVTWTRSDGTPCTLPLTAANAEYALRIPTGSNLMNPPFVAADDAGQPYLVSYWSPATGAPPQFQIVHHDSHAWRVTPGPARTEVFSLAGSGTKHPPISRALLLVSTTARGTALHLVYRDDRRGGRIVAATCAALAAGAWSETELTADTVGAWEPAFDPVQWDRSRQLHMLVQKATQLDGNDRTGASVEPTPIGALVWQPDSAPLR